MPHIKKGHRAVILLRRCPVHICNRMLGTHSPTHLPVSRRILAHNAAAGKSEVGTFIYDLHTPAPHPAALR